MTPPLSSRNWRNGVIEPGEDCDDSNHNSGDGCSVYRRSGGASRSVRAA